MSPIRTDGADNARPYDENSAADELLKSLLPPDAKKPSKQASEDKPKPKPEKVVVEEDDEETPNADDDEDPDEDSDESPEGDDGDEEEGGEEEETAERKHADEGAYVKIKVGDEEKEVPIKDLKRLWGQEAALTKRSQEVADRRKSVDTEATQYAAATQAMLARAQQRYAPFADIDFLSLSRDPSISNEELTALRTEAIKAHEDVQFLTSELGRFMQEVQTRQHSDLVERARASIKELTDPEKGIKGWNEKMYDDVRAYAISVGAPADIVGQLVDPWALKIIHKARLFDQGSKKVTTTKVNKTPKRVVKTSHSPASRRQEPKAKVAMEKLRKSGSMDDATNAFLTTLTAGRDND